MEPLDTVATVHILPIHLNITSLALILAQFIFLCVFSFFLSTIHICIVKNLNPPKTFRLFDHLCLLPTAIERYSVFDCPILDGSKCARRFTHMHTRTSTHH